MNSKQWQTLLDVIAGKRLSPLPAGFIIDSPWLPGWMGIHTLDYFTSDELWFQANQKAIDTFPGAMFLPGFWSEFGMCTEPSAFGAKISFLRDGFPHPAKVIDRIEDIDRVTLPDPEKDGLLPFVLNRLHLNRARIEKMGHAIRFAVARGPFNIASFLMGTTEFLMALRTDTEKVQKLLQIITDYTVRWLRVQKSWFDTIDGILILDDIVGFCGQQDFREFAAPCLKSVFSSFDASVRFFHNDADGRGCSPHLAEVGVNLFNFSYNHSLREMKEWTRNQVVLLGQIPPRDVLAQGSPQQIADSLAASLDSVEDRSRIILSCGGGMPDGVSTENIRAFLRAAARL
jgi:uroporphyrinogen-III decarboxylase